MQVVIDRKSWEDLIMDCSKGFMANPNIDPLNLTEQQMQDLVAKAITYVSYVRHHVESLDESSRLEGSYVSLNGNYSFNDT